MIKEEKLRDGICKKFGRWRGWLYAGIFMKVFTLFAFLIICSVAVADDAPDKWLRWTSRNFVVLVPKYDFAKAQGEYLKNNLDNLKIWVLNRWGLDDVPFGKETIQTAKGPREEPNVKLWCIDNSTLFEESYGVKDSTVEVIRNDQNDIRNIEAYILLKQSAALDLPMPITEIALAEFENNYRQRTHYEGTFGYWAIRGMGVLNKPVDSIKEELKWLHSIMADKLLLSSNLFSVTKKDWLVSTDENKHLFDVESAALCLMLRKEFGQMRFLHFLKRSGEVNPEIVLKEIYEFDNYNSFDKSFNSYMRYLTSDVVNDKTPNAYLTITRAMR